MRDSLLREAGSALGGPQGAQRELAVTVRSPEHGGMEGLAWGASQEHAGTRWVARTLGAETEQVSRKKPPIARAKGQRARNRVASEELRWRLMTKERVSLSGHDWHLGASLPLDPTEAFLRVAWSDIPRTKAGLRGHSNGGTQAPDSARSRVLEDTPCGSAGPSFLPTAPLPSCPQAEAPRPPDGAGWEGSPARPRRPGSWTGDPSPDPPTTEQRTASRRHHHLLHHPRPTAPSPWLQSGGLGPAPSPHWSGAEGAGPDGGTRDPRAAEAGARRRQQLQLERRRRICVVPSADRSSPAAPAAERASAAAD